MSGSKQEEVEKFVVIFSNESRKLVEVALNKCISSVGKNSWPLLLQFDKYGQMVNAINQLKESKSFFTAELEGFAGGAATEGSITVTKNENPVGIKNRVIYRNGLTQLEITLNELGDYVKFNLHNTVTKASGVLVLTEEDSLTLSDIAQHAALQLREEIKAIRKRAGKKAEDGTRQTLHNVVDKALKDGFSASDLTEFIQIVTEMKPAGVTETKPAGVTETRCVLC